jgi:hypothetical protein
VCRACRYAHGVVVYHTSPEFEAMGTLDLAADDGAPTGEVF